MQSLQSTMIPLAHVLACTALEPQTGQLKTKADFGELSLSIGIGIGIK